MYYKIIQDGCVIDAQENLQYVTQNIKSPFVFSTAKSDEAMGIISSDYKNIWHLDTLKPFLMGDYEEVSAVEIDKEEYERIRAELEENGAFVEDTVEEENAEPQNPETPIKKSQLISRIEKLEAIVDYISMVDGIDVEVE